MNDAKKTADASTGDRIEGVVKALAGTQGGCCGDGSVFENGTE